MRWVGGYPGLWFGRSKIPFRLLLPIKAAIQCAANSTTFAVTIELTTNYMPCWSVVDVLGCALICTAGDVAKQAFK